ncbi:restriction endonuclease subunit S [Vibrio vulnificus]|uniref:restriction endonuclease subunit S n=1 Tax=Vibrio vulnificus TaxID=672 RepID=UPI0040590DD3|nr:restriction endonuclease subunit S [Vibrio vulnificus]
MVPNGWERKPLEKVAEIRTGVAKGKKGLKDPIEVPYLRVANVQDGHIDLSEVKTIKIERHQLERYSLQVGDVLMTEGGDFDKLGRGDVWQGQITPCLNQNHVFAVRPNNQILLPYFLAALSGSNYGKTYFLSCAKRSTNLASINSTQLKEFPVLLPPLPEQRKIAKTLSTWDKAIATTEKLIETSKQQKKALMQQLLTGKKRLGIESGSYSFQKTRYGDIPQDWEYPSIREICTQFTQKNVDNKELPVLSCSKHLGFVDSLKYFKKKVYSDDTSGYKVIPLNFFGFPSNHIEEGSIGLQRVYDYGIVSPIYVIFQSNRKRVDNEYLFSVLKTEHYRQIFCAATNASVDRRGSLRWKEFSAIHVPLPPLEEQQKIAAVLKAADKEIELLEAKLAHLKEEKKALMQQLLTGKRRVSL